ncbi:unnamed protein product [Didymodactylos carnosus]|uniref:Uncharacterized protein n=1 Tax=Didymodactylos carnosus TaxID=1234261 RepID=A0A814MJS1_9BILA|nr:unnamed protein product [Didymodactylos carnosus]CAF3846684.1 unnamed protein product [Didymodactylos carnosus]
MKDIKEELIRQKVDNRHWQLFESRLKQQQKSSKNDELNYTKKNDYFIVEQYGDKQKTMPNKYVLTPTKRWQKFCEQLSCTTTDTHILLQLFQNVWFKDWNTSPNTTLLSNNENIPFLEHLNLFCHRLSATDSDKTKILDILTNFWSGKHKEID